MNALSFLKLQQLKKISSRFDDEILGLEYELKSLQKQIRKERFTHKRQSFRMLHGSVDINNLMKLDVLKYPLVEKEELEKLRNEYNKTMNLYGKNSNKTSNQKLEKIKKKFDE